MGYAIRVWDKGFSASALAEIAALWNGNAAGRHAFFPWTGDMLAARLSVNGQGVGTIVEARGDDGALRGFSHITSMNEDGYPAAGVVEMILVDAPFRRQGMGTALLAESVWLVERCRPRPAFIDALGAWPFGYAYNGLADGSERSGVFLDQPETYRLFRRAGFQPVRKSLVMRAELWPRPLPANPAGTAFYIGRRRERTWLDRVFRSRELWDHELTRSDGRILSRSIYGLMAEESRREGATIYSLFGVNTPRDLQGKGFAGVNIAAMMEHVRGLGGQFMELHVYTDNDPALALYRGLGFKRVAETTMMHKRV